MKMERDKISYIRLPHTKQELWKLFPIAFFSSLKYTDLLQRAQIAILFLMLLA